MTACVGLSEKFSDKPWVSLRSSEKSTQIIPAGQANRVLIDKPSRIRLVIPHQVVMQPRFFITILVLQPERLMNVLIDALSDVRKPQAE